MFNYKYILSIWLVKLQEMPLSQRTVLYFSVLLFSVPAQYFISEYCKIDNSERLFHQLITKLHSGLTKFQETFCNLILFRAKIEQEAFLLFIGYSVEENKKETSALDILKYSQIKNNVNRPKFVLYRVGQVVGNVKEGYKSVIIAWHLNPKVEEEVLYTLLIDDSSTVKRKKIASGIPQDHIYGIETTKVKNRYLKIYFDSFDGSQYIPQPWLKARFPKD